MPRLASTVIQSAAALLSIAVPATTPRTQCTIVPGPTYGLPGYGPSAVSEVMRMRRWDPDGPGPQPLVVLMAGTFPAAGAAGGSNLAVWDPVADVWAPVGNWLFGRGQACAVFPNGDLAVSSFDFVIGQGAVARWNGSTWTQLGGTFDSQVIALTVTPNGDLYLGGYFNNYNGAPLASCARWDGQQWQQVGTGLAAVDELVTMPNGDVVAGGLSGVTRWDGATWTNMGASAVGFCLALELLPNGDLLAGGLYGGLARWNGATWTQVPGSTGGSSFYRFEAVHELPNGDLLCAGQFSPVSGPSDIAARWDGSQWQLLTLAPYGYAGFCLLGLDGGDVLIGGAFATPQYTASVGMAQLTTTCPASVAALGSGCPSSGGSNTVTANLPWTGSTWTADATGLPAQALALVVHGFSTAATPLGMILPQGQPGCSLLVQPDFVALIPTTAGTATASFDLPNTSSLAGIAFHHQMVVLEVDASLLLLAATATNALTVTVGTF